MRVGVLGSGIVGKTLAEGLLKHDYPVMRSSRSPEKLDEWLASAGPTASAGTFEDAVAFADCIVLAVKGTAAEQVIESLGPERLDGKVVIDATNPIADQPPVDGILTYFTDINLSLMERLQASAPGARFVKAFSSVGFSRMVDPDFDEVKPTMFICGNDEVAKRTVTRILDRFGWETEDMGPAAAARAIEPLAMLWCIPGFRENRWNHAFRLLQG